MELKSRYFEKKQQGYSPVKPRIVVTNAARNKGVGALDILDAKRRILDMKQDLDKETQDNVRY